MTVEKEINSVDEVTEAEVKYFFVDEAKVRTGQWIHIKQEAALDHEYMVCYNIFQSQIYSFATDGSYVHTWKTLSGVLRFIKKEYSPFIPGGLK